MCQFIHAGRTVYTNITYIAAYVAQFGRVSCYDDDTVLLDHQQVKYV